MYKKYILKVLIKEKVDLLLVCSCDRSLVKACSTNTGTSLIFFVIA